jgi:replicative DNA helicase
MPGRQINQTQWPDTGPHRQFLKHLDRVHQNNGLRSVRQIGNTIPMSHTAVNQILRGQRLPADQQQVSKIIRALGGGVEDAKAGEELYLAARLHANRQRSNGRQRSVLPQRAAKDGDSGYSFVIPFDELLRQTVDKMDAIASQYPSPLFSVPTGFADFDMATGGGFGPGQLIILGGQPSVGKSALALNFARSCAVNSGKRCALFSLEMSRSDIMMRLLAAEARIRLVEIRSGLMDNDSWTRLARRLSEIVNAPLLIDDSTSATIDQTESRARAAASEDHLKLIVIDYLELLHGNHTLSESPRILGMREVARRLKLLAKELNAAVVAVTQLGLKSPRSNFGRPEMIDLREPSVVEDADIVILLHRPDQFDLADPRAGEADLIIAKNRNGPTFTVTVAQQLHYCRFI